MQQIKSRVDGSVLHEGVYGPDATERGFPYRVEFYPRTRKLCDEYVDGGESVSYNLLILTETIGD